MPVIFLEEIRIPLPSLPKQKEIAEKVEAMRTEISQTLIQAESILEKAKQEVEEMILGR